MDERRLIGEEQKAARVFVESTDAGHAWIPVAPALGEESVNVGALAFVVRTNQAERLVDEQEQAVGVIEGLAINADVGGVRLLRNISGDLASCRHTTGLDPIAGLATTAVAEIGEELIEAAHREG
jgi:hypothetical protein